MPISVLKLGNYLIGDVRQNICPDCSNAAEKCHLVIVTYKPSHLRLHCTALKSVLFLAFFYHSFVT